MKYRIFLKYIRESRNLTQQELVAILGCSRSRLSRIETAQQPLYLDEFERLVQYFKKRPIFINQEQFYFNDESMFLPQEALRLGGVMAPLGSALYELFYSDHQKQIKEFAQDLRIFDSYFNNLSNPLPGALLFRLLQTITFSYPSISHTTLKKSVELFLDKSIEKRIFDRRIIDSGAPEAKLNTIDQQYSIPMGLNIQWKKAGQWTYEISIHPTSPLARQLALDPVLAPLCQQWLQCFFEEIIGLRFYLNFMIISVANE